MTNITYNLYRRYSKFGTPIPVITGLVEPTFEMKDVDYDKDVYLTISKVIGDLEVFGDDYTFFIPFETSTIEASYSEGVITVNWSSPPIYVDSLYLYISENEITNDNLPQHIILNKDDNNITIERLLNVDEMLYIRIGSVRNNTIKLSNEVYVMGLIAPYNLQCVWNDETKSVDLTWEFE